MPALTKEQKKRLLMLARDSISSYLKKAEPSFAGLDFADKKQGAFVTLHKNNSLRGCIGFPEPVLALKKAIYESARAAAFSDPRFPRVLDDELKEIDLEISVLTVPEKIKVSSPKEYKDKIEIGKDGLIIKHPQGSGLLLPQVPVEWNWKIDEYLANICQKAGLMEDAWKDKNAELFKFQAEIFSEKEIDAL